MLEYALEIGSVRKIARVLKVGPSTVSRHVKYWIGRGYLIRTSPPGVPATFAPGPNLPRELLLGGNSASNTKTNPTVGVGHLLENFELIPPSGKEVESGFIPMRIHSLGHRFYLERDDEDNFKGPTQEVPWTKSTKNSGVPNHVLMIPMSLEANDTRLIKIVYREGQDSQSVDIWTPEVLICNPMAMEEFDIWAANRAQNIANWLARRYGFRFGLMELCQPPHYAAAVPREVAKAAKEIGLRTPELWMDNSRGPGDLETDEKKMAMALHMLPYRVKSLEEGLVPTLERLIDSQNQLVASHTALLNYLQKLLGLEDKEIPVIEPDSDLGGMYG